MLIWFTEISSFKGGIFSISPHRHWEVLSSDWPECLGGVRRSPPTSPGGWVQLITRLCLPLIITVFESQHLWQLTGCVNRKWGAEQKTLNNIVSSYLLCSKLKLKDYQRLSSVFRADFNDMAWRGVYIVIVFTLFYVTSVLTVRVTSPIWFFRPKNISVHENFQLFPGVRLDTVGRLLIN